MSVVNIESFDKQDKVIFADLNAEIILFSKGFTLEKGFTFRNLKIRRVEGRYKIWGCH